MKPIKIDVKNAGAINAALNAVNGKATAHVFTLGDIIRIANDAESRLYWLVGCKGKMSGAMFWAHSGEPTAKAYKYKRNGNRIEMIRNSTGWVLVKCESVQLYPNQGGTVGLVLTPEQNEAAINHLRGKYTVER